MSEKRYFINPYEDFGPSDGVLDATGDGLNGRVKEDLMKNLTKLLKSFEDEVNETINPNDCSVYTGSTGYALLYLHLALVFNDHKLLDKAIAYTEPLVDTSSKRRLTYITGDSGVHTINAYIHYLKANQNESNISLRKLKKLVVNFADNETQTDVCDELLYGRSGFLYSLLFVRKFIQTSHEIIEDQDIRAVVDAIIKSGQRTAKRDKVSDKCPLMYYWHQKQYIGAAHGLMGIMSLLLEAKSYLTDEELDKCVKPTIDYILSLRMPSGNYPSSLSNPYDRLVHWCHGSAGAVNVFALAYEVFKEERYLMAAKDCGEHVWEKGLLVKGYGLCHGTAGNGYAFLRLYQLTGEEKYVFRAVKFGQWCCAYGEHGCLKPDHPLSMFEGLAGTLYYLTDLLLPKNSRFPGYQIS